MKDPAFTKRLVACASGRGREGFKIPRNSTENIFGCLVDLVTEASVAIYHSYIKSDISTYRLSVF